MSQEIVMVLGYPASGKTTLSKKYIDQGYTHLNRDKAGGRVRSLAPKMEAELTAGKSVVLDNLFAKAETRKPFLDIASRMKVPIRCEWMTTSLEDAQVNALHRMWDRYGKILFTNDKMKEANSPNIFPVAVLFKYRKEFEKPTTDEGFATILKIPFDRHPPHWLKGDKILWGSAIIFDYDGTLRETRGPKKWPEATREVTINLGRAETVRKLAKTNLLLGASNQSAVAKGLSEEVCIACFDHTNKMLKVDIDYVYCPHKVPPVSCYCRKPQSGMGVHLVRKHGLDPAKCVYVGDQTTDKTFARRMGFQYEDHKDFFREGGN